MWVSLLQVSVVIATLCGIAYWLIALWCAFGFRSKREAGSGRLFRPPVSILKPLCGLDPHAYENLRSHCVQDYPEFEIIFGVSEANDASVPMLERLIVEFPRIPIKVVVCSQMLGTNRKISNLIQMLPEARHDFLLINDSDVSVPKDYLKRVTAPLEDRSVGLVTCLYRGIASRGAPARLESLGISSEFVPAVLCAELLGGGVHFGLGSTLMFPRRTLDIIGGLEPLADYLADDYEIGYRTSRAGLRVELADCIVDHWLPDYTWAGFVQHQLRWGRTVRCSRPGGYAGLLLTFVLPWSVLLLLLAGGASWAWFVFASALLLRYAVTAVTHSRVLYHRGSSGDWWLLPIRDFAALLMWVGCYAGRRVSWRGIKFELVNGKLRPV
jgi:ceramide glucosyltransferase